MPVQGLVPLSLPVLLLRIFQIQNQSL
jgi:hypothetical protein